MNTPERDFRLITDHGTIFLELCEDGQPAYRIPMTPHDAVELAQALVMAVSHVRGMLFETDIQ